MTIFVWLALPLAAYTLYAAGAGAIWVSEGAGARRVTREASPAYFWTCVAIYAGLAVAMATLL